MTDDDPKLTHHPHPRAGAEPAEVLAERERAQFRTLVLAEAKRAAQLEADRHRYRHLQRDRRVLLAQLAGIEAETKEIEGRHARHLLKSS